VGVRVGLAHFLRCAGISGICMPNPSIVTLMVSEILAFIRADGQTDIARSTPLVILIKNVYTLWSRKRFLLPVTYFPTNLVYPFNYQTFSFIKWVFVKNQARVFVGCVVRKWHLFCPKIDNDILSNDIEKRKHEL